MGPGPRCRRKRCRNTIYLTFYYHVKHALDRSVQAGRHRPRVFVHQPLCREGLGVNAGLTHFLGSSFASQGMSNSDGLEASSKRKTRGFCTSPRRILVYSKPDCDSSGSNDGKVRRRSAYQRWRLCLPSGLHAIT